MLDEYEKAIAKNFEFLDAREAEYTSFLDIKDWETQGAISAKKVADLYCFVHNCFELALAEEFII